MPNCQIHDNCDLVCSWCGYYCHTEAHRWQWKHVRRLSPGETAKPHEDDMPADREAFYNERAEEMP